MTSYNIITQTDENTVVAECLPAYRTAAEYQSEADLEKEFIRLLKEQRYEYLALHIELKRRGVAIREAFNQIKHYQRDSFWATSGLYEYVQIFVIS